MGGRPSTVLLLVVDSLRHDRLSCYGYGEATTPFLDALAAGGTRVDRAYAPAPWTVPVHGSLFTGLLPSYHGSHRKRKTFDHPAGATLAGALSAAGYRTVGVSANPWLTPESGFDAGFDEFEYLAPGPPFPGEEALLDEGVAESNPVATARRVLSWANRGDPGKRLANVAWKTYLDPGFVGAGSVNDAIVDRLDAADGADHFVFANYMDVHDPHYDDALGVSDAGGSAPGWRGRLAPRRKYPLLSKEVHFTSEPDDPERARELYDRSVERVDARLRELFERLEGRIDPSDTLTVVLGDHGECMGEHGYWGHGTYLHEELLRVPLLVDPPGGASPDRLDGDGPVSLLEVPGYVAGAAGTTVVGTAEGPRRPSDAEGAVFAECTGPRPNMEGVASDEGYRAVVRDGWKLVRDLETGEDRLLRTGGRPRDDGSDAAGVKAELVDLVRERWRDADERGGDDQDDEDEPPMSKEIEDRLSHLGYI